MFEEIKLAVSVLIFLDKSVPSLAKLIRRLKPKLKKSDLQILFIDDENMPIVEVLRKAGYHVKKKQNITSEYDVDVKNSHVIFVDFNDVGKNISEYQGAGVIKRVREKYAGTKYLVLYTAQPSLPTDAHTSGYIGFQDGILRKSADKDQFIAHLDKAIDKL